MYFLYQIEYLLISERYLSINNEREGYSAKYEHTKYMPNP